MRVGGNTPLAGQTGRSKLVFVCPRRPQMPNCRRKRVETAAQRGTSATAAENRPPNYLHSIQAPLAESSRQRRCHREKEERSPFGKDRRAAPEPETHTDRTDTQHQPRRLSRGKRTGGGERWLGSMSFINKLKLIRVYSQGQGSEMLPDSNLKPGACPKPAGEDAARADPLRVQQVGTLL